MKVTISPRRERGFSPLPEPTFEDMLAILMEDTEYINRRLAGFKAEAMKHPLPAPRHTVDVDAVQAFCEKHGITVDVHIIPVAGTIGDAGTTGSTKVTYLHDRWVIRVDDQLGEDYEERVPTCGHDDCPIPDGFSTTLRHELGHVLCISKHMRETRKSINDVNAEHALEMMKWETIEDYKNSPDEVQARAFAAKTSDILSVQS